MTYTKLDSTGKICYVWGSNTDGSNPFGNKDSQLKNEHYLNNSNITTVYLLDSPTKYKIEQRAFQNCANLQIIKTVDQTMEIHPLYGNDSQILYNVSEFDWNCFDNIGSAINFEYQNLNMDRIVFWGQCFYKNKTFNNFKINTNKDKCSVIFSTQMFAGYKKSFDTIEIVAKSLQYEQMATLPTYLDSLIYLAEIKNKLKLDINITNLNDIKEFINNKIFTNRATYGTNTPITMEFSFPNSLMYGVCDTDYASLPYYSTTERLKILPGWTNIEIDNIDPNIQENALQFIDLLELNNEQVNLDKYQLSKCIHNGAELTILLPSLQFYLNNVTPIQPVYRWSNLKLLVPNESGTGGFVAFDTISLDNKINIHDYAFYNCQQLINIIISSQVMSIGKGAFYGCVNVSNLKYDAINCKSFNIQSGNQIFAKLGQDTDNGCLVQIGPNVEKIPTAFMYPEALDIHNPNLGIYPKIQDIQICDENWEALSGNNKNTKLTTIGTAAFKYVNRSKWPVNNWNLTTFFQHCNNLKILGSSAFAGVHSITELYFPDNLVEIGDNCFNECKKLNKIVNTFPSSLTNIHPRAFGEIMAYNKALYNENFNISIEKDNKGSCDLLLYDKIEGNNKYDGYMIYILDSSSQAWLLHHYQVQKEVGVGMYVVGLPSNYKTYGISEKALRTTYDNTSSYGRCDFCIMNDNNQVFWCNAGEYSPKVIGAEAFENIAFVATNVDQPISFDLTETIYLGNRAFTKHREQLSSIMWQYNISLVPEQTKQFCINGLELNNKTILNFKTRMSLFYWLFNSTFIKSLNTLPDNTVTGTTGAWKLAVEDSEIEHIIIEQTQEKNDVLCEEKTVTIKCKNRQKFNTYSLFEMQYTSCCIDMSVCDISNTYIFGPYNCFKHTNADSEEENLIIKLLNGYINNGYDLYKNNNTVFYNPDHKHLCVKEFNVPYYVITKWFKQMIYATKSLTHYTIYGGNTTEDDLQYANLRIYNKSLKSLSLPLTNNTESLIKPSNRILRTWGPISEDCNFSSLENFKLTAPINKNRTTLYLPSQSLKEAISLTEIELDYRITNIGEEAFVGSNNITSVKLVGPDILTLQDWYNITFASITSSPFYSIEWNDDKDNCKLYINDTEQHRPVVEIGEKENYIIQNDNDVKYIKYDPKPFYNYPITGLIFQECFKGEFQDQDLTDEFNDKKFIQPLDITNTLTTIQFNKLPNNEYSVLKNIFRAKTETVNEIIDIKYPNLNNILLDNSIIELPVGCFANLLNDNKYDKNGYFSMIKIGLSNQLQTLGENSFYNCNCYVGEYDENKEVIPAQFNQLKLANNTGLGMGLIANVHLYYDEDNKATYYNQATGFLLKCEPESGDAIDLSNMKIIDLKAIKYETASSINLTIPWLGTCGDAEYVPADQYSALKNWFDIEDTQMVNIDTLHIKNSEGLHGFNPIGTTTPVFQNIKINNLVIEAPNSKPIATNQQHFDSKNMNLNSIVLKMDEIPSYLLSNNKNDLQQINKLHIQSYTTNNLSVAICDKALRTPIINEIIFMSQKNLCGNFVFNDPLTNDYIYYSAPLKDWVRYNSFGNENSNPIRFARKFYTDYINEENKGRIERVLQPDSDQYNDGTNTWRRFYVNSYSLYNNHQVNTIICTHDNAKIEESYTLYDQFINTIPNAPLRSHALIEVIADIYHDSIRGLVERKDEQYEQGDIYASQCFKSGVTASEAIPKEDA